MEGKIKILMIDDEEDLCVVVKANLEDTGEFEVVTLSKPQEAENVIRQENPDVILLDVVMPERKGTEIVAALKKDAELKTIPVIMVSGKGEMVYNKRKDEFKWMPNNPNVAKRGDLPDAKGAEALSQAYGADDYVSKPFTTELLVDIIKDVVSKKRKRSAPPEEESQI